MYWVIPVIPVVVEILDGPLSETASVAEQGLLAIRNLAVRDESSRLLGIAGACEGE